MIPTFETVPVEFDCRTCGPGDCGTDFLRRFDALRPLQAFVLTAGQDPTPLLARLQAERAGLFEWSPLEEGPSGWRIEVARRDAGAGVARTITEALEWDHDRLDRLEHLALDAHAAGDLTAARDAFGLFAHGLRRHIGFEEALLFPEFERRTGTRRGNGPTAVMRDEHRRILALLDTMEAVIGDAGPDAGLLVELLRRRLHEVLGAHNRKEEDVLYPVADSVLAPAERDALVRDIQFFHEG